MVNAIVLLKVDPQKINEVAEQLAGKEHVSEVYSVAGRYDVVVILRARDAEALSDAVTKSFLKVEGVQSSETLMAFRAYSSHDLERMFEIE
jgi:DNA-binding Lrp family transcriptional regulator